MQGVNGTVKFGIRADEEWVTGGTKNGPCCSWASFLNFWKREHSNIIVRKPSRDICNICYQFHIGNRKASKQSSNDHLDSDDKDDDKIPTVRE
jgi:hypothetical protein